ncbi:anti-sigma factor [Kiloniella laminariae]|uniref:Anti-sigma factor n=1 Tax=Kiloniella laminariae TaxID=454162 RepID=A0ABT4LM67_9PROT|nr:anti-sigma factor [Kiloniella laminariae]MCZ4282220.1 anti-sigma factor [Kiloniella laminariae]
MNKHKFEGADLLHAYVDGELTAAERNRVEQWLSTHPEDAERVASWQKQTRGLRVLFDHKAEEIAPPQLFPGEPLATNITSSSPAPRKTSRVWSRLAAAVLWLTIGGSGGWFGHEYISNNSGIFQVPGFQTARTVNFTQPALEAHWVYTPEARHPVEVLANEEAHLAKWLSNRLEVPLTIPDLASAGFSLVGGRLLPSTNGPAAQFMYQNTDENRVTLYLSRQSGSKETAFRYHEEGTTRAFYWYDGPLGYALVGEMNRQELSQLADLVYQQL